MPGKVMVIFGNIKSHGNYMENWNRIVEIWSCLTIIRLAWLHYIYCNDWPCPELHQTDMKGIVCHFALGYVVQTSYFAILSVYKQAWKNRGNGKLLAMKLCKFCKRKWRNTQGNCLILEGNLPYWRKILPSFVGK